MRKLPVGLLFAFLMFSQYGCQSDGLPNSGKPCKEIKAESRPKATGKGIAVSGSTIKIGIVASCSGPLRPWGTDCIKGAQLAIKEINNQGGIAGKKLELLVGDCASKPEQSKSAAERLISQGVICLIGEHASGLNMQVARSAYEKNVPLVSSGSIRSDLTKIGSNIYRICFTDKVEASVLSDFATKELGSQRAIIFTDKKEPYSTELSKHFREYYTKQGGRIVDELFYESGTTDFSAKLTSVKQKNPDLLFLAGYFTEVGAIARQAKAAGIQAKMIGGDGWDSSELVANGGNAILDSFYVNHYNNHENRTSVKHFINKWKSTYGCIPSTVVAALGYDAMSVIGKALKNVKELNSVALSQSIDNINNFQGVTGTISLKGEHGDPKKDAIIVQVKEQGPVFAKRYDSKYVKLLIDGS